MEHFFNSGIYTYLILPALIFIARIFDVSFGTIRIIMVSKGVRKLAPLLGFMEVLIWIIAISQIMSNLNNWVCYIAYALGFATGNYVGMRLEEKLAMGNLILRIMIPESGQELMRRLNKEGFGTTNVHADGSMGKVDMIYTIVTRKNLQKVESIIKGYNQNIFYTIEEVKKVNKGIFPTKSENIFPIIDRWRHGR